MTRRMLLTGFAAAIVWSSVPAGTGGYAVAARSRVPKPHPVAMPSDAVLEKAIGRGVAFLLRRQNRDGSWGSPRNTKELNIYAPVPGAHQAFRAAVTSLCLCALVELESDDPAVQRAIEAGEKWLLANLPHVRRATPDAIYNTWAHAYGIQALVHLLGRHEGNTKRRRRIVEQIDQQLDLLKRYECVDGGWCYYDFKYHTKQPSGTSVSFVSATVLVALDDARQAGIAIPQRLVDRAVESIHRQRRPDFSYLYSENFRFYTMRDINRPGGSLGRSQACNLALRLWGDEAVTDQVVDTWLNRLFARNGWLSIGRKRPVPHESWFHVAGYFYYYGHYYAARCIELLPAQQRPPHQAQLAHVLLKLQEKDGSWWDYPLYDYHQQYGTAFALMSLLRCRQTGQ